MVEVSQQAERLLTDAEQPDLLAWMRGSNASSELTHFLERNTNNFTLTVPLSEIKHLPLEPDDEAHLSKRPLPPITRIMKEIRDKLGIQRSSQIVQRFGYENQINIVLPLNAQQLNDILSIEGIQGIDFSEQAQDRGMRL